MQKQIQKQSWGKILGLILFGFLAGVIFSQLGKQEIASSQGFSRSDQSPMRATGKVQNVPDHFRHLASTPVWQVYVSDKSDGRELALSQNGSIRVIVDDDFSALHIFSYADDLSAWEGRLMDVGNNGTVEVADISNGHCENFSARK